MKDGAGQVYAPLNDQQIIIWNPRDEASLPAPEPIPWELRLDSAFCDWSFAATHSGLMISTGKSVYFRTTDGFWRRLPGLGALASPSDRRPQLISIGKSVILMPNERYPSGLRILQSVSCEAGLDELLGKRITSVAPSSNGRILIARDTSAGSYTIAELSEPDDADFQRCWDRPLVNAPIIEVSPPQ